MVKCHKMWLQSKYAFILKFKINILNKLPIMHIQFGVLMEFQVNLDYCEQNWRYLGNLCGCMRC